MKARLKVQNIGPITDVEITINKVNIFIGPQSIGKSTLAKIISFCAWLEKNILVNQGYAHIDKSFLLQHLLIYHKFASFLVETSFIEYKSELISFTYHSLSNFKIEVNGRLKDTDMSKITYVPAERNIINIPNISTLSLEHNYIRDFIFDWLRVRYKFNGNNRLSLLDLGCAYSFDTEKGDVITLASGKEISLNQTSSGLQALVPLLVFVAYSTDWILHNDPDMSFDNYSSLQKALLKHIRGGEDTTDDKNINAILEQEEIKNSLDKLLQVFLDAKGNSETVNGLKEIASLVQRISKPHSSFLIIEEPEENLFPSTQYELIKHIVTMLDNGRDNTLVVTTHSPYIMTSINNLIQAQHVIDEDGNAKARLSEILSTTSYMSYDDINAWAFANGKLISIKDDELRLISAESLDAVSDSISSDFELLLDYEGN
ncbi:AAA family ATPase [Prevotella bivia]|uniref:AAA family ATPase n=1 Tax=Prevotella bivia TaxID=28125 RepID=UPI00065FA03A|nr:AAA family ATPase [Prevotella bivia]